MARKKDSTIDLAFSNFDTLVNTFFKEATGSLEELQKPKDPPQPRTKKPVLNKISNPFNIG